MGREPIPGPGFLNAGERLGYLYGEQRRRDRKGREMYTWDALHGEIEVYSLRGRHLGVADPMTGKRIKSARKERRIRV